MRARKSEPGDEGESGMSIVDLTGARVAAPAYLTDEQAAEWRAIVDSLPASYFRPGDIPLLAAYVISSVFYRRAAADVEARGMTFMDDKGREYVNPSHQLLTSQASAMAQMAIKLRLCPSARMDDRTAATKAGGKAGGARPWEEKAA